jgi:hypothetical protein
MLRLRALPVQSIRQGTLKEQQSVDLGEEPLEEQFRDSDISIGKTWNATRNTMIRGKHRDDLTDALPSTKPKKLKARKKAKKASKYSADYVLREQVRNQNDRGYKRLDEFQEEKKKKLVWRPEIDFDETGDAGMDAGLSTEQGDAIVEIGKDSFQKITLVEPYASARKFSGVKLRGLK